jgi:acetylornithine deacetylase/succinyl-diaminopimelate desuccinylase-like protein
MKQMGIIPPRDIVMLSTCDEEMGGIYGIQWMLKNHRAEIDPEYVIDEGGVGSRDLLAPASLLFGIAGRRETDAVVETARQRNGGTRIATYPR